ncbi:MAG TPA: DUF6036 family nucleotidyltransferase [Acidimicrobiia bacterium]|nr:DUF6036 family nucleotidyltransferase [Acidimicrobiia bacterium]
MLELEGLEEALATLGEVLDEGGHRVGILVIGGSSLLIHGIVRRPTADVDVIALAQAEGYAKAETLPAFLAAAVREVGEALGLGPTWINAGPAGLVDFGLPPGLEDRVKIRRYGGLDIHLPAPQDLIPFKLYAAVDQGERSKHFADLQAMAPTRRQLIASARWTRTHDPSPGFLGELRRTLSLLGVEVDDADL